MKKPEQKLINKAEDIVDYMEQGAELVQQGQNNKCTFTLISTDSDGSKWETDVCHQLCLKMEKEQAILVDCHGAENKYYFVINSNFNGKLSDFDHKEPVIEDTPEQHELTEVLSTLTPALDTNLHLAYQEWMDCTIAKGAYEYVRSRNETANILIEKGCKITYKERLQHIAPLFIDLGCVAKDLSGDTRTTFDTNFTRLKNILIKNGYTEGDSFPRKASEN
jgi:hypothetical protein